VSEQAQIRMILQQQTQGRECYKDDEIIDRRYTRLRNMVIGYSWMGD
jgi:hypothetical protein